jgi:hypothetical protein
LVLLKSPKPFKIGLWLMRRTGWRRLKRYLTAMSRPHKRKQGIERKYMARRNSIAAP